MLVFPQEDYATEFVAAEQGAHYSMVQVCSRETINAAFNEFLEKAALDWGEI